MASFDYVNHKWKTLKFAQHFWIQSLFWIKIIFYRTIRWKGLDYFNVDKIYNL
jgi:hypothetical protein